MRYAIDNKPEYYMSLEVSINDILNNKTYAEMTAK